jgi:hypothetical protein
MCNYFETISCRYELCAELDDNSEARRMQSLWRSVITQALIDAASNSKKKIDKLNRVRAIQWLQGESEDFLEVCVLANMDPDYVKRKTQEALKRGCKWRNDLRLSRPIRLTEDLIKKPIRKHRKNKKHSSTMYAHPESFVQNWC